MANLDGVGGWLDDRFGGARPVRNLMNKVFPDHWTFMLGEVALWTFVIELLTGADGEARAPFATLGRG
jgi:quinol---cytochrome-c reductase cytochrome b subunit